MTKDIIEEIKQALASEPRNRYMAELHLPGSIAEGNRSITDTIVKKDK